MTFTNIPTQFTPLTVLLPLQIFSLNRGQTVAFLSFFHVYIQFGSISFYYCYVFKGRVKIIYRYKKKHSTKYSIIQVVMVIQLHDLRTQSPWVHNGSKYKILGSNSVKSLHSTQYYNHKYKSNHLSQTIMLGISSLTHFTTIKN